MMSIPEQAIESGKISVYADTDREFVSTLITYNEHMAECRLKKKRLDEIAFAYNIVNPLIIVGMIAGTAETILRHPLIAIIILIIYAVLFIAYSLSEIHYIVSTLLSILLWLLDLRFIILTIFNITLSLIYRNLNKTLKAESDYPVFRDIYICYEKGNDPAKQTT